MMDDDDSMDEVWREEAEQLDEYLRHAARNPGATALSLASNPATGKSTTLIQHIAGRVEFSSPRQSVTYLVQSEIEAHYIRRWLFDHEVGPRDVHIVTPETLTEHEWPDRLIMVVDISWYPTVDDVIALCKVLDRATTVKNLVENHGDGPHMAIILLMSAFKHHPIIQTFRKYLGDIKEIDLLHRHHQYPGWKQLEDGWQGNVDRSLRDAWAGEGRVIVGGVPEEVFSWRGFSLLDNENLNIFPELGHPTQTSADVMAANYSALTTTQGLVVEATSSFAPRLQDVGLVLCTGRAGSLRIREPKIMQPIIISGVPMTRWQVLRILSWGIRSGRRVVYATPQASFADTLSSASKINGEALGPAWNHDFQLLLLSLIEIWPDRPLNPLLLCLAPDVFVTADCVRRLMVLGCVVKTQHGHDGLRCTEFGLRLLNIWRSTGKTLSFQVAFLLARVERMARNPDASPLVCRVLIYMAAIAQAGTAALFEVTQPVDMAALVGQFPPVVPVSRRRAGSLWVGLGLYLFFQRHEAFPDVSGIEGNEQTGQSITDMIKRFEEFCIGVPSGPGDWTSGTLSEADVRTIDKEIMWAWLHRTAAFLPKVQSNAQDESVVSNCVLCKKLWVDMDQEIVDKQWVQERYAGATRGAGFFVIYEELAMSFRDWKEKRKRYLCTNVTWIPNLAFHNVEAEIGKEWPYVVGRSIIR